jgi:hypothetical protein
VSKIAGKKGVTNYFHELGAGHFLQMAQEWGSLMRYRNEGAEAKNGDITRMFLSGSNMGGFKGNNQKQKKNNEQYTAQKAGKIEGIGRWCGRMFMWESGRAGKLFESDHWLNNISLSLDEHSELTAEEAAEYKGKVELNEDEDYAPLKSHQTSDFNSSSACDSDEDCRSERGGGDGDSDEEESESDGDDGLSEEEWYDDKEPELFVPLPNSVMAKRQTRGGTALGNAPIAV